VEGGNEVGAGGVFEVLLFHSLRLNVGGEGITIPVNDLANHESKKESLLMIAILLLRVAIDIRLLLNSLRVTSD
jgi:hypothetical protein